MATKQSVTPLVKVVDQKRLLARLVLGMQCSYTNVVVDVDLGVDCQPGGYLPR